MKPTNLGRNVRTLREAAGLSQSDLAARCGVKPACIALIEQCKRKPSFELLCNMIAQLQCRPSDLLTDNVLPESSVRQCVCPTCGGRGVVFALEPNHERPPPHSPTPA